MSNPEAGIRPGNTYFARDSVDQWGRPIPATDPLFHLYSKEVITTEHEWDGAWSDHSGTGNYAPQEAYRGQEETEISVEYELQQFPVDNNDDPVDAVADFVYRDADHGAKSTHTFLEVEEKSSILAVSTVHDYYFNGTESDGRTHPVEESGGERPSASPMGSRIEAVAVGCTPGEAEVPFSAEDNEVIVPSLSYTGSKYRVYQTDHPDAATTLGIRSTALEDTDTTVHIEPASGGSGEELTLDSADATTVVQSASSYQKPRIRLGSECTGTVEVYAYDTTTSECGQLLTYILGSDAQSGIEGDRGVPMIGSGSFQAESELGDSISSLGTNLRRNGQKAAVNVMGSTLTVQNEVEATATDQGFRKDINQDGQTAELESTMYGPAETPKSMDRALRGSEGEMRLSIRGGEVVIPRAYCPDPGTTEREGDQLVLQREVIWRALQQNDEPLVKFVPSGA